MSTSATIIVPAHLKTLGAMALMLEKLDREQNPDQPASAEQYLDVVRRVQALLAEAEAQRDLDRAPPQAAAGLEALLNAFPSLAELYENQHYAEAGLCRHDLQQSLQAELDATALLRRARQPAPPTASATD